MRLILREGLLKGFPGCWMRSGIAGMLALACCAGVASAQTAAGQAVPAHKAKADPAQDPQETVLVDDRERTFVLHLPAGYDKKKKYPLVVMLEGKDQDADQMAGLTHFNDLADQQGVIVAYPNSAVDGWNIGVSPKDESDKPRRIPGGMGRRGGGGYPGGGGGYPGGGRGGQGGGDQSEHKHHGVKEDDFHFIESMLDKLEDEYSIDETKIYAAGLGDGGFMSLRLGCGMAKRFAAVAAVGAEMPKSMQKVCFPTPPISLLLMNGTNDPVVPYKGGSGKVDLYQTISAKDTAKGWAEYDRCSDKPVTTKLPGEVELDTYGQCHPGSEVLLYSIKGAGNTWPGGEQFRPEDLIGKTSRDLDANAVIWKFFTAHQRTADKGSVDTTTGEKKRADKGTADPNN